MAVTHSLDHCMAGQHGQPPERATAGEMDAATAAVVAHPLLWSLPPLFIHPGGLDGKMLSVRLSP